MPESADPLVPRSAFEQDATPYRWFCALLRQIAEDPATRRLGYAWGVIQAAHLAAELGVPRISVLEFGVAGGNGLIALERIAARLEPVFGVGIDVFGFDTGVGLPKPTDYRDVPNLHAEGNYLMDVGALRARLTKAHLVLGPISRTLPEFIASAPAPVGFAGIDVDYYSSTVETLRLFEADPARMLPRVFCRFDDILGFTHSEFTGELLAIQEFNDCNTMRKVSRIPGLRYFLEGDLRYYQWPEQMFIAHCFDHPDYGRDDGLIRVRSLPIVEEERYERERTERERERRVREEERRLREEERRVREEERQARQKLDEERRAQQKIDVEKRAQLRRTREVTTALRRAEMKAVGEERVVIFGAGIGGERALRSLPDGRKAIAFCDNEVRRQGTTFCGLPVIGPAQLAQTRHEWVLIASSAYREIFTQLAEQREPLDRIEILARNIRLGLQKG